MLRLEKPNGLTGTRRIYRQVDLSTCTSASLSLDYSQQDLEENILVEASADNVTYNTVFTIVGTNSNNQTAYVNTGSRSLDSYIGDSSVYIRFSGVHTGTSVDRVFFDNVQVSCTYQTVNAITLDNVTGGNPDLVNGIPPSLVVAGDNFALNPGQSMTVTFQVTVNDPVALGSIDNTASVVSVAAARPAVRLHQR